MIIGVDPGTTESAICWLSDDFIKADKLPNHDILSLVARSPHPLAIEMFASYGMAVGRETFESAVWLGRFVQAHGGQVRYVYRREVKLHICGTLQAKDSNIRQALIDRYGEPGTKKSPGKLYGFAADMWSALAIALTAKETPLPQKGHAFS